MTGITHRELVRKDAAGYEIWLETSILPNYTVVPLDNYTAVPLNSEQETEDVSELIQEIEGASGQTVTMEVAYTPSGKYIGTPTIAALLCNKRGIAPETTTPEEKVCSIGFSARDQKWYGWSHRAIYGFIIGDVAAEGDCVCSSGWTDEYLAEHPEDDLSLPVGFEAKTLDDAKRIATAFAESVS